MAWRFRKSFKILPGVRVNLGKRGASVSVGGRGLRVTSGSTGTRVTASAPGTGLSISESISSGRGRRRKAASTGDAAPAQAAPSNHVKGGGCIVLLSIPILIAVLSMIMSLGDNGRGTPPQARKPAQSRPSAQASRPAPIPAVAQFKSGEFLMTSGPVDLFSAKPQGHGTESKNRLAAPLALQVEGSGADKNGGLWYKVGAARWLGDNLSGWVSASELENRATTTTLEFLRSTMPANAPKTPAPPTPTYVTPSRMKQPPSAPPRVMAPQSSDKVWVKGYRRKDGTWVEGHYRSKPKR